MTAITNDTAGKARRLGTLWGRRVVLATTGAAVAFWMGANVSSVADLATVETSFYSWVEWVEANVDAVIEYPSWQTVSKHGDEYVVGPSHAAAAHDRHAWVALLQVLQDFVISEAVVGIEHDAAKGIVGRWGVNVKFDGPVSYLQGRDAKVGLCSDGVWHTDGEGVVCGVNT